jgi:hypothetical protein
MTTRVTIPASDVIFLMLCVSRGALHKVQGRALYLLNEFFFSLCISPLPVAGRGT